MRGAIGQAVKGSALTAAKNLFELRKALAKLRVPEIYSGTGDIVGPPVAIADERTLAKALALTQGMRLMGQRYIPEAGRHAGSRAGWTSWPCWDRPGRRLG